MKDSEIIKKAKEKFNKTFYNEIYEAVLKQAIVLAKAESRRKTAKELLEVLKQFDIPKREFKTLCKKYGVKE